MTDELTGFPRRLRLLMDAEGLTTHTLAKKAGVSHSAIAQWINGTNKATIDKVRPVAEALGWDAYELLHERVAPDIVDRLADVDAELRTLRRTVAKVLPTLAQIAGVTTVDVAVGVARPKPNRRDRAEGE